MPLRPSGQRLWDKHVENYTEIFRRALTALSKLPKIDGGEDDISIQLNLLLQQKCFEYNEEYNEELPYPLYNLPIPPATENKNNVAKQSGRPDFTCCFRDRYAKSYDEYEFGFHIECKCLGLPSSSNWIFNKNYVNHGIMRFDLEDKRYGENVSNGMMIGYILSMRPEDICKEVNTELIKTGRNFCPICFRSSSDLLRETTQQLERIVVTPATFTLTHLWIVLNH